MYVLKILNMMLMINFFFSILLICSKAADDFIVSSEPVSQKKLISALSLLVIEDYPEVVFVAGVDGKMRTI